MTTAPRTLTTPHLEAQTFAIRRTCRASHAHALADLADDAAGGHPSQRATITRTTGGTYQLYYQPTAVARYLRVTAIVAQRTSSYTPGDAATIDLSVRDTAGAAVTSSSTAIPYGLKADVGHRPASVGLYWTVSGAGELTWWLDVDQLVTAGLDAALLWRITVVLTCGASVAVELVHLEEAPRMLVDTAEAWGQIPTDYQPRGIIQSGPSGLQRIGTTARVARVEGIRTYHALAVPESAPWTITSTSMAAWPGDTESAGVARKWVTRARKIRGTVSECRARYVIRYRNAGMAGADKATVRLYTGAATASYDLDLTDLSGSWVTSSPKTVYLPVSGDTTLCWEGKVTAGSCEIVARPVWDYPE